jgi:hypothetical protein
MWGDWLPTILVAIIAALPGLVALYQNRKKNEAETDEVEAKTQKEKAETESIHAEVADRWAAHVNDLMKRVDLLEQQHKTDTQQIDRLERERTLNKREITGLRLDIQNVRRDNEQYRTELTERDAIISDMKDWTVRLIKQFRRHIPDVEPEQFIRRSENQWRTLTEE